MPLVYLTMKELNLVSTFFNEQQEQTQFKQITQFWEKMVKRLNLTPMKQAD